MKRFFVKPEQIAAASHQISLQGPDVNHIRNVLRMKPEDELWVSDGSGKEYHCKIETVSGEEVLLHILYVQESDYELPNRITLFQGLPKGDKMEFIIQKAVELGAAEIVPVRMQRCVVKLDDQKAKKKQSRWQQIAESAAKQSRRMLVPEIREVLDFSDAVSAAGALDLALVPYELAEGMAESRKIVDSILPGQSVGVFIGPEGGFEESEISQLLAKKAIPLTLGRRILRTETAGMAILSILMFHLEKN